MSSNLQELVSHHNWVPAEQHLGQVFQVFTNHDFDFMAVLEGGTALGLCSRRDVGMSLGSQYGFSLFAGKPVKGHVLPNPVFVKTGTPIDEVFTAAFARGEEAFYEDVILLGRQGEFLGLISTQTLARLQNQRHLENIRLLERQSREIRMKNEQIEEELRLARELQQALLPAAYPSFPPRSPGGDEPLRFHHYYRPFGPVGGDFFHIQKLGDGTAGVFIADVMGHGVRSALVTAMLRAMLGELAAPEFDDPARLMGHVNRELCKILSQVEETALFATALYVRVDAAGRRLNHASAAHPPPIHARRGLGRACALQHPDPGTVLGVFEKAEFANGEVFYEAGDALILFTDGISEAANQAGEEFGLGRMSEFVAAHADRPARALIDGLIACAGEFAGGTGFTDDMCLIGVDLG